MISETFSYIEDKLSSYVCIAGDVDGYFTATLLRRKTVVYDKHDIIQFEETLMQRNLTITQVGIE